MKATSHLFSVIRGSVGGITYTATRTQAIVGRTRVGPARLATNNQTLIRTVLVALQAQWRVLTQAKRQGWADYADTVTFSGPNGTYKITGQQMFFRCLSNVIYGNKRGLSSLVETYDPPILPGQIDVGPIIQSPLVTVGTGVAISVTNETGIDATAFARITGAWGPGRNKSPNNWDSSKDQMVDCDDAASTLIEFTGLNVGAIYFVSIRMMAQDPPYRVDPEFIYRDVAITVSV